jgi:TonB family protein
MLVSLVLLLVALTLVLYRDRDFWFPDAQEADSRDLSPASDQTAVSTAPTAPPIERPAARAAKVNKAKTHPQPTRGQKLSQAANDAPSAGPTVTATRTVLPPLEVEVVAGDAHRTLHPGSNSVHVDLERPRSGQGLPAFAGGSSASAAAVTTPAAERTSVSTDAATNVVMRSIQPEYPMLARQMRVQGSVILQALIGRDGLIQDLRVISGPPILANAAQEAVRQWHFKPHFVGTLPVETRANITVNFTISTN